MLELTCFPSVQCGSCIHTSSQLVCLGLTIVFFLLLLPGFPWNMCAFCSWMKMFSVCGTAPTRNCWLSPYWIALWRFSTLTHSRCMSKWAVRLCREWCNCSLKDQEYVGKVSVYCGTLVRIRETMHPASGACLLANWQNCGWATLGRKSIFNLESVVNLQVAGFTLNPAGMVVLQSCEAL